MRPTLIALALGFLLASCNGYKIIAKNSSVPTIKQVEKTGTNYCIVRTDEYPEALPASFDQLEIQGQNLKQVKINPEDAYTIPVLSHNDLIFEFSFNNIYNCPKVKGDWRTFLSPILFPITIPASTIYMKKKDAYLVGRLRVYSPNGDLIATYENFEPLTYKKQAIMDPVPHHEVVTEVFKNGYSGLINNLVQQYNQDAATHAFIDSKQKMIALKSIAEINQDFFSNYYSKLLKSLEDHAKISYDIMSKDLTKKFKRNQMTFEEDYIPIAFNRYVSLKANRLLMEKGKSEAETFLQDETQKFEKFWEGYSISKERIINNRERTNMMLGTLVMSVQQTSNVFNSLDRNRQTTSQYLQVFSNALQRNIAANYPQLNLNPNTPSLFVNTSFNQQSPISQAAVNNFDNALCSETQQRDCKDLAHSDGTYLSWKGKSVDEPNEYNALHAAIAISQATLKYCASCLNAQQKASINQLITDCNNRLSLLASDKYVSSYKPNYTQSVRPPGYGYQTANQPLNQKSDGKTKVSTKAN